MVKFSLIFFSLSSLFIPPPTLSPKEWMKLGRIISLMCSKWSPVIWFSFSWQPLWQRDFPRMGAMISLIIHSFVTSFLSRGRVYVPCLWIWDSLWLMQNRHHKIQFMPGSLGMLNLGTQSPRYAESTREVHRCLADSSSLHQCQLRHWNEGASRRYHPPAVESPTSFWVLLEEISDTTELRQAVPIVICPGFWPAELLR